MKITQHALVRLIGMCLLAALPLLASVTAAAAPNPQHYDQRFGVLTVTSFDLADPWIALTFEASADRGNAAHILEFLRDEGVKASFSVTGVWAQSNPDLIRWIVADGHTLINMGWDNQSFAHMTREGRFDQLARTEDVIRDIAGVELPPFFRPPFGDYDDATLVDLDAQDYAVNVLWSIDSEGGQDGNPSDIAHRVADRAVPGSIVLMRVDENSHDVFALLLMIDHLKDRGFNFGTLADFILGSLLPMRYYPPTDLWVYDNMLYFWDAYGGLPVFGYPISEATVEGDATVQYFERTRMEHRPGAWPDRYDVLLGLLGVELTADRMHEAPFKPVQGGSDANCTYYPETGHRLCFAFRDWWEATGGLMIYGYPISEEYTENGQTVQWFERARFEWHAENDWPWKVLLGHLGYDALERSGQ